MRSGSGVKLNSVVGGSAITLTDVVAAGTASYGLWALTVDASTIDVVASTITGATEGALFDVLTDTAV